MYPCPYGLTVAFILPQKFHLDSWDILHTVKRKIFPLPYFPPILNSPSYNIDYTFYMRMFIRPCFELAHCQLGKLKQERIKPVLEYCWNQI